MPKNTAPTEVLPDQAQVEDTAKREARKAATDALIEAHKAEWEENMHAEHDARGVEWKRRMTPEERDAKEAEKVRERAEAKAERDRARDERALAKLLADRPGLADRIVTGTEGAA